MKILKRNLTPSALIAENRLVYFGMENRPTNPDAAKAPKTEKPEIDKSGKLQKLKNPETREKIEKKMDDAKEKRIGKVAIISAKTLAKLVKEGLANVKVEDINPKIPPVDLKLGKINVKPQIKPVDLKLGKIKINKGRINVNPQIKPIKVNDDISTLNPSTTLGFNKAPEPTKTPERKGTEINPEIKISGAKDAEKKTADYMNRGKTESKGTAPLDVNKPDFGNPDPENQKEDPDKPDF